jgi:hypothetical protein
MKKPVGHFAMRIISTFILLALLSGCASSQSPAHLTVQRFQQIHVGMSRDEVYQLLGKPQAGIAQGVKDVMTEIWVAAPDSHGQKVRLSLLFGSDGRAHQVEQDILNDYN